MNDWGLYFSLPHNPYERSPIGQVLQQLCLPYKMSHHSSQHLSCSAFISEESDVVKNRKKAPICYAELVVFFSPLNA